MTFSGHDLPERFADLLKSLCPGLFALGTTHLYGLNAIFVHKLPAVTHVVGNPPFVELLVKARLDAVDTAFIVIDENIFPAAGKRRNAGRAFKKPDALGE